MFNGKLASEDILEKKAKATVAVIYYATQQFLKHIKEKTGGMEGLKELENIDERNENLIINFALISFLFQAQKFFWEKVIKDKKLALKFETAIYDAFKEVLGVDPEPYILEMGEYIKKKGPRGEVEYLGNKVCKELGKEDLFLMLDLSAIFIGILKYGFFESLKRAWELKA